MSGRGDTSAKALRQSILAIAVPATLTGVATALFGMADTWVIGRLGDPVAQGAVEVGARLLMTLLIVFNFLRSSTVAMTAQAAGRDDAEGQALALTRAMAVAGVLAVLYLLVQPAVLHWGPAFFGAHDELADQARTYVFFRYGGGVAWLANAVLTGWLIGRRALAMIRERATWHVGELLGLMSLNRDLFLRTLLLMGANLLFTRAGAHQGPVVLAANAILLQLFLLGALALDGFESAAQVLTGEAIGKGDRAAFDRQLRAILAWAAASAAALSLIYLLLAAPFAASFSTDREVIATARHYAIWAAVLPLVGVTSFVFDGAFIGAAWTRGMLITMAAALAGFVGLEWLLRPWGNHGLWLAFCLFFVLRAAGQAGLLPGLARRGFPLASVSSG